MRKSLVLCLLAFTGSLNSGLCMRGAGVPDGTEEGGSHAHTAKGGPTSFNPGIHTPVEIFKSKGNEKIGVGYLDDPNQLVILKDGQTTRHTITDVRDHPETLHTSFKMDGSKYDVPYIVRGVLSAQTSDGRDIADSPPAKPIDYDFLHSHVAHIPLQRAAIQVGTLHGPRTIPLQNPGEARVGTICANTEKRDLSHDGKPILGCKSHIPWMKRGDKGNEHWKVLTALIPVETKKGPAFVCHPLGSTGATGNSQCSATLDQCRGGTASWRDITSRRRSLWELPGALRQSIAARQGDPTQHATEGTTIPSKTQRMESALRDAHTKGLPS